MRAVNPTLIVGFRRGKAGRLDGISYTSHVWRPNAVCCAPWLTRATTAAVLCCALCDCCVCARRDCCERLGLKLHQVVQVDAKVDEGFSLDDAKFNLSRYFLALPVMTAWYLPPAYFTLEVEYKYTGTSISDNIQVRVLNNEEK